MSPPATSKSASAPSSNWLALKNKIPSTSTKPDARNPTTPPPKKRRKMQDESDQLSEVSFKRGQDTASVRSTIPSRYTNDGEEDVDAEDDSKTVLRKMIAGELKYSSTHQQPGKYIAMDCEMVGVGPEGRESSLARVSIANYYGHVLLDAFVRQRERVVDYRTQWSGIRPKDMINARPFDEVQKMVADLLKDRILVGHAVYNDLKVLLLSHPRPQTRDTQVYAHRHKVVKTRYAALRNLVQQELGVTIQTGEHSSVTDARATMAIFRLHHKEWEKGKRMDPLASSKKRRRSVSEESRSVATTVQATASREFPGGGRKGVSSGLSTIVKRKETSVKKDKWWTKLG